MVKTFVPFFLYATFPIVAYAQNEFTIVRGNCMPEDVTLYDTPITKSPIKAYLQDQATLTADASKKGVFKAGGGGNAITFENKNGKFLTVLSAAGSLTDAFSATDNNLTLARYPVSGNNAEATFGLITISGNKGGATMMSQVNVSSMAITTSGNTAVFTNDATSAFRFADTSEPTPDPVPDAKYTLSPASGSQVSGTKLDVTLTFTGITNVTVADRTKIKLVHGEQVVQATSVTAQQDNTQFAIVFNGLSTGTYILQIEKGAFTYPYNGKTAAVQAITATYIMTEKAVPSPEILAKAEALLAMTGIGYPASNSPARLALKKLVDAKAGTNNEFNAAIDAYLADTNIEKPANGKYYRMVTRSKAFQSYFALDGSKLKLQADAEGAAVFKATANADGTTTLMAVNDKYLSLPTATGDYLSFNYDKAAHDLTLSRLIVSGVSNEETFGLISMSLGGKYAVMTLDETTATVQEPRSNATYGSYQTSALKFEEASELEITMPDVDYTVTPGANTQVESMEKITIAFASRNEVKLKDVSKIKLLDAITDKVYLPKSITKVEGAQNTFDMTFINLPARTYNLNIAKGAFVVNFLGREEPVQEIVVKYITVTKEPALAKDFDTYYNLRWVDRGYAYVTDVSLNNFRLKANTAIELIENAQPVTINNYLGTPKASGHFVKTEDSHIVRLALDSEIKEGDLRKGEYTVEIKEMTLCDANYIQYLADNSSVSLSSCHVNPKVKFTVNVDNEKAAQGIEEPTSMEFDKDGVTYVLNDNDNTAMIKHVTVNNNVVIPNSITVNDGIYVIISVGDSIFKDNKSSNFMYIEFPESITKISEKAFDGFPLWYYALIWNSDTPLPAELFSDENYKKSNFLLYLKNGEASPNGQYQIPLGGGYHKLGKIIDNVIVDNIADEITLHEEYPFSCPRNFTVQEISYTHNYQMETGFNECAGWETIALPFDVQTIVHETKGELVPFSEWDGNNDKKPFWLYSPSGVPSSLSPISMGGPSTSYYDFVKTSDIKANTPYIISFPNNNKYSIQYNLNGHVTFSAENVEVQNTSEENINTLLMYSHSEGSSTDAAYQIKTLCPAYFYVPKSDDVYALNVTNDYFTNDSQEDTPGSIFINNYRMVAPFETYIKYTSGGRDIETITFEGSRKIPIVFQKSEHTSIQELSSDSEKPHSNKIYNLRGCLIRNSSQTISNKGLKSLPSGIYIINRKKVVVK